MEKHVESDSMLWYQSRHSQHVNLSRIFCDLGTLLIDGDALAWYLKKDVHHLDINFSIGFQRSLKEFMGLITERGFTKFKIVFFNSHSLLTTAIDIRGIFSEIGLQDSYIIFEK